MRTLLLRLAFGLVTGLIVLGTLPALIVGFSLDRARDSLSAAEVELRAGSTSAAALLVDRARSSASSAESASDSPILRAIASLTGMRDDLEGINALATALHHAATGGARIFEAARGVDAQERDLAEAVYRNGQIDLATVAALESAAGIAEGFINRGARAVAAAPTPRLGIVSRALRNAARRLDDAGESLESAASVLGVLPDLAGSDGPKRYFLAFQSPSEARGGGGLIGVYGVLTSVQGRFSLSHIGPIEDLVARLEGTVAAPDWFDALYGGFSGTREFRFANMSPHFPTTAPILLRMYKRATGDTLDGVIALDPFALGELTRGTGPLSGPGWDREITRLNVRRVLLHDIYRHFDLKERIQNQYLQGLVDELWRSLEGNDLDVGPMLEGLAEAVREQRVKIYVPDDEIQTVLSDLAASGDYTAASPGVQMLFNNNFAANKVDYFLHRSVETSVFLNEDGSARVEVEVSLENDAPVEPGSVLVRPFQDDLLSGLNSMGIYLLLPAGARPGSMTIDDGHTNILRGREGRHPVAWQLLEIPPQKEASLRLVYRWPEAFDVGDGTFELTLWPQATARPDTYSIEVHAPAGYVLATRSGSTERLTRTGRLKEPVAVKALLEEQGKS